MWITSLTSPRRQVLIHRIACTSHDRSCAACSLSRASCTGMASQRGDLVKLMRAMQIGNPRGRGAAWPRGAWPRGRGAAWPSGRWADGRGAEGPDGRGAEGRGAEGADGSSGRGGRGAAWPRWASGRGRVAEWPGGRVAEWPSGGTKCRNLPLERPKETQEAASGRATRASVQVLSRRLSSDPQRRESADGVLAPAHERGRDRGRPVKHRKSHRDLRFSASRSRAPGRSGAKEQ
jgi:hypothetical protein